MASSRSVWIDKATAVVPLVALSTFCAFGLTGSGVSVVAANIQPKPHTPAPGTIVPDEPLDVPASESSLDPAISAAPPGLRGQPISSTAVSPSDIPGPALSAYQRAATVINHADKSCQLPWELLAAIGRVESHHGTYGGGQLDSNGVARPSIIGIALDGTRQTSLIRDTDRGNLDGDRVHDRAVGPMQFIPSTWAAVGVDADGDKLRNPQDVDDAALAAAVYLCAGSGSLAKPAGQRVAVLRYNHSDRYADVVLSLVEAYQNGDFGTTPSSPSATRQPGGAVPANWDPAPAEDDVDLIVQAVHEVQASQEPDLVAHPVRPPSTSNPEGPGQPTDPTDPTEPTDPPAPTSGPNQPTEPTASPTDPTETASPSAPSSPTSPTDPSSPPSPSDSASPSPSGPTGADRAVSGTPTGDLLARLDEAARSDLHAVLSSVTAADAEAAETTCFEAATAPYDDAALTTCLTDLLTPTQP